MRGEPQFLESCCRSLGRAAPEVERRTQLVARAGRVCVRQTLARLCDELLEALEVELAFRYTQEIARLLRH